MRLAGIAVLLAVAACGKSGSSSSGPAWPKSAGWEPARDWKEDGGESIDPRDPEGVAAIESAEEPPADGNAEVTVEVTPGPLPPDAPTPPPGDVPPVEPVPDETIIIEGELPPDPPPDPPPPSP